MEDVENFVSHLPQPSRHGAHSPSKGLTEAKTSTHNSRIGGLVPPGMFANNKRQGSQLPEPANKQRKTLAERAGEPLKPSQAAPPSILSANSIPPSTTSSRNISNTSSFSQSYRTASTASRATSQSSTSSISNAANIKLPGTQPISQLARPKTSLAKERPTRTADARPKSSHGTRGGLYDGPKPKRMTLPSHPLLTRVRKTSKTPIPWEETPLIEPCAGRGNQSIHPGSDPTRDTQDLTSALQNLNILPCERDSSPSRLPRPMTPSKPFLCFTTWTPLPFPKSPTKMSPKRKEYLTRFANTETWDPEEQYGNMERMYQDVCQHYKQAMDDGLELKETNSHFKTMVNKLDQDKTRLLEDIIVLKSELQTMKYRIDAAETAKSELSQVKNAEIENLETKYQRQIEEISKDARAKYEDLKGHHRKELDDIRQSFRDDIERLKSEHREELKDIRARLEAEVDKERIARIEAVTQASSENSMEKQKQKIEVESKEQEIRNAQAESDRIRAELDRERCLNDDLRKDLTTASTNATTMEVARQALQAKIEFLESDNKSQSEAYAAMERRMNEAIQKAIECEDRLRKEETMRKRLHNQVQELKGNIRVFCRVRPMSNKDSEEESAKFTFPETEESNEIEVRGLEETNSLGKVTTKTHPFSFDRVFNPSNTNQEIFDEIGQLIQSALDGYNVCIFAYGQTGSGKTYTMSSEDGMIPRALRQIYETSKELETRGWTYTIEGSFVEVYNEEIRDLLGKEGVNDKSNKKHEIRHDMIKCETTITDVTALNLDSPAQVEDMLAQAMAKRSVAATSANERSSRSHSVFILKLAGQNSITGEKSRGTLNLVDLAGSERLSHSKAEGARLKETQNINKSLSCLGDVIGALGQQQQQQASTTTTGSSSSSSFNPRESVNSSSTGGGHHIPYRNSKLTYLLQFSLGGNSKTLMFVMVAPEKKCLGETITSLKFADKVARTKIGVAKKVVGR